MTEKHTILQVFTQQNETTRKNGENPVTATVFNLTQLHENVSNLLAFCPLITRGIPAERVLRTMQRGREWRSGQNRAALQEV